ncbi:MAG: hypothetical protein V3W19_02805, partial [Desulfatiglandales bacterium]
RLATVLVELRKKRWNTIILFLESPITSRSERITPLLRYSNTPTLLVETPARQSQLSLTPAIREFSKLE